MCRGRKWRVRRRVEIAAAFMPWSMAHRLDGEDLLTAAIDVASSVC